MVKRDELLHNEF
jgi:hypothetical protein